jgi:predicted transcriptional regulator
MMKVCINCHTENPVDEVLCSECGMSLRRAATGEEAVRLKTGKRTQPEQPPSASGIVFLFGEQFATLWEPSTYPEALILGTTPSVTDGRDGRSPVRAPYSGQSVWQGDLATRLFEGAFVSLVQGGYIFLHAQKRKGLLRATEAVAITVQKSGDDLPPSLERAIMQALRGDPKEDWVKSVVGRVIGGRDWSPQQRPVDMVLESLVKTGWLDRVAGPVVETTAPLLGELDAVKAMVHTFATELPDLHESLLREIQAGMQSRLI